jgi:hypothetical protein
MKHKTRHAPSKKVDVRFHFNELEFIDSEVKKRGLKYRADFIRPRVLKGFKG